MTSEKAWSKLKSGVNHREEQGETVNRIISLNSLIFSDFKAKCVEYHTNTLKQSKILKNDRKPLKIF